MFNKRGFTLVETLFAFQVFLIVVFISGLMIQNMRTQNNKLIRIYNDIAQKEEILSQQTDIIEAIEMVLH